MPKQVDHDERRRRLTEALLRIAGTRGLQAVSMREIAAEAGVSLRVVQYYFTNKQALLDSGLAELGARMDRRVPRPGSRCPTRWKTSSPPGSPPRSRPGTSPPTATRARRSPPFWRSPTA